MMEGFLKAILQFEYLTILLTVCDLHIVPMLNPDGVIVGNSRTNLSGVDINRRWGDDVLNEKLMPEVSALKNHMK